MSEPFSLAAAEASFTADDWEHMGREVAAAPPFSPEQVMALRALFAASRPVRPADPTAEAPASAADAA